jgi:hypothetical protein
MAQRRNSSGRGPGNARSDLDDVKALAAKARQETGGPVPVPNASELSGMRARRDSVIGMRLTPPPRATGGDLPNWIWGLLGCLSVLLVGFGGLLVLGRSGKLGALVGGAASMVAPAPTTTVPAPAPAGGPTANPLGEVPEAPAPSEHAPVVEHVVRPEHAAHVGHAAPANAGERAPATAGEPEPAAAAPEAPAAAPPVAGEPVAPPAAPDEGAATKRAARPPAAKSHPEPPAADDDNNAGSDSPEAKAPVAAARPARAAAPAPKAAQDDSDTDDSSLPGQDAVEGALDALSSRVRGCFVKYQIKGTARVRLVATPAGKAESVSVTGDFEDTPTGLCVESVVSEAKLPTFKGPPLKLSQSYQLR